MKKIAVPLLCASLLASSLPAASASALPLAKSAVAAHDGVTVVQWGHSGRGRGGWGHGDGGRGRWDGGGRHRGHGPGPAGILGAIIAGTLIAAAISEGRAQDEDIRRCEEDFYSFDPRTGTYINRYGEERVCPYLR